MVSVSPQPLCLSIPALLLKLNLGRPLLLHTAVTFYLQWNLSPDNLPGQLCLLLSCTHTLQVFPCQALDPPPPRHFLPDFCACHLSWGPSLQRSLHLFPPLDIPSLVSLVEAALSLFSLFSTCLPCPGKHSAPEFIHPSAPLEHRLYDRIASLSGELRTAHGNKRPSRNSCLSGSGGSCL